LKTTRIVIEYVSNIQANKYPPPRNSIIPRSPKLIASVVCIVLEQSNECLIEKLRTFLNIERKKQNLVQYGEWVLVFLFRFCCSGFCFRCFCFMRSFLIRFFCFYRFSSIGIILTCFSNSSYSLFISLNTLALPPLSGWYIWASFLYSFLREFSV